MQGTCHQADVRSPELEKGIQAFQARRKAMARKRRRGGFYMCKALMSNSDRCLTMDQPAAEGKCCWLASLGYRAHRMRRRARRLPETLGHTASRTLDSRASILQPTIPINQLHEGSGPSKHSRLALERRLSCSFSSPRSPKRALYTILRYEAQTKRAGPRPRSLPGSSLRPRATPAKYTTPRQNAVSYMMRACATT